MSWSILYLHSLMIDCTDTLCFLIFVCVSAESALQWLQYLHPNFAHYINKYIYYSAPIYQIPVISVCPSILILYHILLKFSLHSHLNVLLIWHIFLPLLCACAICTQKLHMLYTLPEKYTKHIPEKKWYLYWSLTHNKDKLYITKRKWR